MMSINICVYPISPTYSPFHRYLYYISLLLSVLYPTPPPIVAGAFAFSLTYASTAAIYAVLIVALPSQEPTLNLDIFGVWAVLSVSSIVVLPLLTHTKSVRPSVRPIVRIWAILISVATICAYVLLIQSKGYWIHPKASSSCSSNPKSKARVRNPEHAELVDYDHVFGSWHAMMVERVPPLILLPSMFGFFTCILNLGPAHASINKLENANASQNTYGPIAISVSGQSSVLHVAKSGFLALRRVILCATPFLLIPTIVLNELYLMKHRVEAEELYEVGQWGVFVGAGVIALAALINSAMGKSKARMDEFGLHSEITSPGEGLDIIR